MRDPQAWLEANVPLVTRAVTNAARRGRMSRQERDDLQSAVWTHLIRDDYRALRLFRGSSAISTYLRVVVERVSMDLRASNWGKWRPSAAARRLGDAAVTFERLVGRDGYSPQEARMVLGEKGLVLPPEDEARLSTGCRGPRRRFVGLSAAAGERAEGDPLAALLHRQQARRGLHLGRRLKHALACLPPTDRVLVTMRHGQGLKVSEMAVTLGVDQKRLYRRLDAIHAGLRARLVGEGVTAHDAAELTAGSVSHLPVGTVPVTIVKSLADGRDDALDEFGLVAPMPAPHDDQIVVR